VEIGAVRVNRQMARRNDGIGRPSVVRLDWRELWEQLLRDLDEGFRNLRRMEPPDPRWTNALSAAAILLVLSLLLGQILRHYWPILGSP
jgi:hypothetical protein